MTGRVVPLNASEHAAIDALLPWYVNGTLRGDELGRVERHDAVCPACRREVDWLKDVFAACAAIAPLPDVPASLSGSAPTLGPSARPRTWRARVGDLRSSPPWIRWLMALPVRRSRPRAVMALLICRAAEIENPWTPLESAFL